MNAFSTLTLAIAMTVASAAAVAQESHAGHGAHGSHGAHAAHGAHGAHASHAGHDTAAAAALTDGEVKKIDKETGKITLRHGEIKNLNMAAMTMVLRVKDGAMLDQVAVGDKVRFAAERVNGAVTVVQLQKVM